MSLDDDPRLRLLEGSSDDDRVRLLGQLDQPVQVVVSGEAPTWRHQVLAITLIELLSRLHPRIEIVCPDTAVASTSLPPGPETVRERLEAARARGHPVLPPDSAKPLVVFVGPARDRDADVHVDAFGWQAYVGSTPSALAEGEGPEVAIGAVCAAARGAAQVFRRRLAAELPSETIHSAYWSALDYRSSDEPLVCAGDTLSAPTSLTGVLVGAGSVGGAAAHAFAFTPDLDGALEICDPQNLERRNYVKALLADRLSAEAQAEKAQHAAAALAHQALTAAAHKMTIEEFVASRPREQTLPLVLCAVDSIPSRRSIQDCLPLEVVNAACNGNIASVTAHRTDDGPCVYCLHIEKVLDSQSILVRRIALRTGMPARQVVELIVKRVPLQKVHLRAIERHLGKPELAYARYEGVQLDEFYRQVLVYGEVAVEGADNSHVAVAAPFITALAGFLLAGEALKVGTPEFAQFRLGPLGQLVAPGGARPTKYEESLFDSPSTGYMMPLPRWPGNECLCRSNYRLRILRQRYGLEVGAAP